MSERQIVVRRLNVDDFARNSGPYTPVPAGWKEEDYRPARQSVRKTLKNALSKVHIGSELRSLPGHSDTMPGVTGYVVVEGEQSDSMAVRTRAVLLGLGTVDGNASIDCIGKSILDVIQDWQIQDDIGGFVCDDLDKNNDIVPYLLETIEPDTSLRQARRGWCISHIVHLSADAYLTSLSTKTPKRGQMLMSQVMGEAQSTRWRIRSTGRDSKTTQYHALRRLLWSERWTVC